MIITVCNKRIRPTVGARRSKFPLRMRAGFRRMASAAALKVTISLRCNTRANVHFVANWRPRPRQMGSSCELAATSSSSSPSAARNTSVASTTETPRMDARICGKNACCVRLQCRAAMVARIQRARPVTAATSSCTAHSTRAVSSPNYPSP